MNLSVLHISDLHRDPDHPIRNDILIDSLENDRQRYQAEESIRPPDIAIVSGDIVHGIAPDASDATAQLRRQYAEALDFLTKLAERFLAGDRSRIVVVPGNHDVSSYHFEQSLKSINIAPDRKKDLVTQLFRPGSRLRWSWSKFKLYEIIDEDIYARRLEAFTEFYSDFYMRTRSYSLDASQQLDVFDFPQYDLAIAGFSSCYDNDLFNKQGAIHPACVATAADRFRHSSLANRLRLAVWHHNTEGAPWISDYMDPDTLQNLIDRGFSLGFHGHQHRPQFLDVRFRHGTHRKINVISAGTLCGSASFRHGRAYNVIELDTRTRQGRLHVREMQNNNLAMPIWGKRALPPSTSPFYDFQFDSPPAPPPQPAAIVETLVLAQQYYEAGQYREVVNTLTSVQDAVARPLLLDCLVKLRDTTALLEAFGTPSTEAEAVHVMDALWETGQHDELRRVLALQLISASADLSVIEIRQKYKARLRI